MHIFWNEENDRNVNRLTFITISPFPVPFNSKLTWKSTKICIAKNIEFKNNWNFSSPTRQKRHEPRHAKSHFILKEMKRITSRAWSCRTPSSGLMYSLGDDYKSCSQHFLLLLTSQQRELRMLENTIDSLISRFEMPPWWEEHSSS